MGFINQLGCKEWDMEKPKLLCSITPRFRSRCVFVSVALVLWWAFLMVQFSLDRRHPPMHSSLEQPLLSLKSEESVSMSRRLSRGQLSTDSSLREGIVPSAVQEQDQETWSKNGRLDHDEKELAATGVIDDNKVSCEGRYIYMYELDPYFNEDMVKRCDKLSLWTNWCPSVRNAGLGPPMENTDGVFSDSDWYITNQFMLEQIFHNRIRRYECLTHNASLAEAVFVPFYAGFEITTKLWAANITERDEAPARLLAWLSLRAEWARFRGVDHFLVGGRITWDFRRSSDAESDWGNKLFVLPATANMTMLTIEASPWHHNDVAIPYPTYFHPSSHRSLSLWQARMRASTRPFLFSFVGAPRPGLSHSIRGMIMRQCSDSAQCKLLDCQLSVCLTPHKVMAVFEQSVFCLQPSGDSYTRRSTFDAMLAGCIPVFFHQHSAYDQYQWHLPADQSSYSVLISESGVKNNSVRIDDVLGAFSDAQVVSMRDTVIRTIPHIVYADPRTSPIPGVHDAFDITVQGVIDRIAKRKVEKGHINVAGNPSADRESESELEESMKEQVAREEMKKSEEATGWRDHRGFAID
ncbi:hypothetical protein KC19_4G003400 [Ceratodon purpureus]|uniref:Exostosin GT47 domain-containing protein n=1 Tax=Ceratodon purpureus TaxID=3225 RepID=A0A8T0I647_CERPU|nr:hypothetical protein KC19_4G003400 [Ceratodon purpureus]